MCHSIPYYKEQRGHTPANALCRGDAAGRGLPSDLEDQVLRFCGVDGAALLAHVVVGEPIGLAAEAVVVPELGVVVRFRFGAPVIEGRGIVPTLAVGHDVPVQRCTHLRTRGQGREGQRRAAQGTHNIDPTVSSALSQFNGLANIVNITNINATKSTLAQGCSQSRKEIFGLAIPLCVTFTF